jgi:NAD+ synthase (glutamine-hydrolysing)
VATIRLGLAQLDVTVGDLEHNADELLSALRHGADEGCDLVAAPELALVGYPPEDLLLKEGFVHDAIAMLEKLAAASPACVGIVGAVVADHQGLVELGGPFDARDAAAGTTSLRHPRLANAAVLVGAGRVLGAVAKRALPNYAVFDEQRWFSPGTGRPVVLDVAGAGVGVAVCEDIWDARGPCEALAAQGAGLIVVLNASPYARHRLRDRREVVARRVAETGGAIAYVNLVGGQDELVFDGGSFVLDAGGRLVAAAPQFESHLLIVDLELPDAPRTATRLPGVPTTSRRHGEWREGTVAEPLGAIAEVYEALVVGTRDYFAKNGFTNAVIGLSGGIDSSLVAVLAVDALGPDAVFGVSMPSRYSSAHSRSDASDLASRLGIRFDTIEIERAHAALADVLSGVLGSPPAGLTDENLQSRIRGVLLMAISNATGALVLTTGNKSELATGYSTLYGDSAGGFAVIKDVVKTLVYELCRHCNEEARRRGGAPPIPESVLDKPPSAELREGQLDEDSLPAYELLDPVLEAYIEADRTVEELVADGHDRELVERVASLVDLAEYKRRQMPPGVRVTAKSFGRDRRLPITNRYGRTPRR